MRLNIKKVRDHYLAELRGFPNSCEILQWRGQMNTRVNNWQGQLSTSRLSSARSQYLTMQIVKVEWTENVAAKVKKNWLDRQRALAMEELVL